MMIQKNVSAVTVLQCTDAVGAVVFVYKKDAYVGDLLCYARQNNYKYNLPQYQYAADQD